MNDKVLNLYNTLKSAGADVGTEKEFNDYFFAKGDQGYQNRYNIWNTFKSAGADVGNSYEEFRDWLGLKPANQTKPTAQPVQKPAGFGQLDTSSNQYGRQAWKQQPSPEETEETVVEKQQRMLNGGATPQEEHRIQGNMQQRQDEIDFEKETGQRMHQPVLSPEWEAPTLARDEQGNILRDENGNPLTGFSTDEGRASGHQQRQAEQAEWDALSQKEKNERMKQMRLQYEKDEYKEPTLFETIGKKLGSGFMKFGLGTLETLQELTSGMIVEDASSPTGYRKTQEYDEAITDPNNHVQIGLNSAQYTAERMSREAEPKEGKGFLDMLWDGEIGSFLQKGVGTAMESLPMTLSIYSWPTMILNGISMAGNNYREQTLDNPDVAPWKRFSMAAGSAAIEQVVEMFSDPLFKYVGGRKIFSKAAKEGAEELSKEITQKATESMAQRIYNGLAHLAKDAAGEGAEEVITNFGNDALGEALDLLNGEKNFGLRAQWDEIKKKNPDASLWDFAVEKAKENIESFIGGAMAGAYTSGTTQASVAGLQYAFGGKVTEEDIANNPNARIDPVTMEVAQSFDDGYASELVDEKKHYVEEARAAEEILPQYGQEFAKMVSESESPVETMDYLMQNRDLYTNEQIEVAADYFQKQARAYGVLNAAEDAINTEVERANAVIRANTHQATGNVVTVQDNDGDYFVLSGDIDPTTGQLIGTGGAMVVKNMQTGEVVVKSPQQLSVTSVSNADELIQQNETVLREQLTQQADDDITYGSPANEVFDMEDTVTLQDGQGSTIEGQVVALPNAVDGVYVVQTSDDRALQMTADELNRRIVNHNGVEVKPVERQPQPTEQEAGAEAEQNRNNNIAETQPQHTEQGATLNNAGGEAGSEQTSGNEPPASALSRIPVRMDGDKPVTDMKGRPVRDWHKASVEDAAAALVETTGGDMLMARDTAKDLIDQGNAKLEKIRKQKPKGDDPLEIAESRMEIKRQEQEQQAIIKQWKDVNQHIQQQMEAESQRKIAEREAAKSEEQRKREAEEARIRKEQQDEQDRQRLREQIERDREKRNKEYEPLTQAKREMADRSEAMAILEETEPRSLEEWVSSQLRPHSMLWQDASDSETGLQTELGMKRADMQRMMTLLGTKESGAKPFGQVVLDIHEGLPEGMKEQYTDQDVRNTLLNLFNEGSSTRMMHLTEEHRIEEARELTREMERREAEAEMDAWCQAYHLTPEERETFEDFMQQPPSEPEQEIINNIIIDGEFKESLASSETMDQEPVSGTAVSGTEGGESQVQEPAQSTGNGTDAEADAQGSEAPGSEPTVSDNQVSGRTPERDAQGRRYVDIKANLKYFFDNIGVENGDTIVDRMSTYELDELLALVEDWETINSEYGEVIEEKTADLKGKDKKKKEAAKKAISAAEEKANEAFVPIEEYVAELSAKYNSPEYEEDVIADLREPGQSDAVSDVSKPQAPNDNGREPINAKTQTSSSESEGTNNISNIQENLGKTSSAEEIKAEEAKVDPNPTESQKEAGNYQKGHINIDGYDITIENPKGSVRRGRSADGTEWETLMNNTYGYIRGTEGVDGDHIDVFLSDNPTSGSVYVVDQVNPESGAFDEHKVMYGFASEEEAREAYLSNYSEGWQGLGAITPVSREEFKKWVESSHRKTKPFAEYKSVKKAETEPQPTEQAKKPAKEHKYLVSDEEMEEIRKKLLAKLHNLNAGIDPELMLLGAMYAGAKIERGFIKFADYAREMVNSMDDTIRPYLKSLYNAIRDMPEAQEYADQMDDYDTVQKFDVFNFDKGSKVVPAIEKAEQVTKEQKVKREVKKIKQEQPDLFAGMFEAELKPQPAKAKPKTAWWNDPNRPQSLDPSDYRTYTTDEAKAYFAQFKSEDGKTDFTKWAHPNLAYITAAAWDGAVIPLEELEAIPEIREAESRGKKTGSLNINEQEKQQHIQHLLDTEHGSAVMENGKIKKVNGEADFSGPVKQERKAFIVIGRPAGGKSSVFANGLSFNNGARIVDSDVVKPWLKGFDDGYGAGYVQNASASVADAAMMIAAERGDNMVIPRIGGSSVIDKTVIPLIEMGYDVQLFYNDVSEQTSIMRAASRFAEEGRYLSLQYLTTIKDKISKTFINFAEKKLGDYYDERNSDERPSQRNVRTNEIPVVDGRSIDRRTEPSGSGTSESISSVVPEGGRRGRNQTEQGNEAVRREEPIFSYVEWKSNDVAYGEKPKEIWNSKSGKPMPIKEGKDNDARNLQQVREENRRGSNGVSSRESSVSRSADDSGLESDIQERGDERQGDTGVSQSDAAVSSSTSGQLRPVQGLTQQPAKPRQKPKKNLRNNRGERGKDYAPTSPKARFNANVAAIKLMRELMDNDVENPTDEQKAVLRQYSGWGGLGTFFNDESSAENAQLRDLLTEEEYKDAVMSINSAYYTPATVIDTLWDVAKAMGFKGGNVLEGSAGIGNIIGQMPKDMSLNSDIEAVEIDTISGNILKLLYPDAKVHVTGFQDVVIPNNSVDLAVTNVPFVTGLHVYDKADKDLSRRFTNIHDFCIAKNIRKLREGGIGLFITSSGTLDKSNDLRKWMADEGQADVVGAFRLNNETFGGTNVTSDIIVVRKRTAGKTSEHAIDVLKASPLKVGTYKDKWGEEHQVSMTINDYFKTHPEMMAGDMAFGYEKGDTFRPGSYGLYPAKGKEQDKMLADFVKSMEGKAEEQPQRAEQPTAEPNQLTAEKEGRMLVDDKGRLCVSERGQAVPLQLNATKVKGYTKEQCFKDYQEVQKAVDDVLQQQLSDPDDAALKPKLDALNKAFDKFVKRYGTLHKNTAIAFLRNDIDFPSFQALEDYSESKDIQGKVTVKASKTPLFSQRVLGFKTEPKPQTVKDAIIASIFRTNGIDLDWIAAKLSEVAAPPNGGHWTADDVRKGILVSRLGFENPETGQLEIRYKYLSGNVREKLAQAEAYNQDGKYNVNIEELKKVIPMDIPAHLIDFSLGSSWIPIEIYNDYLSEIYGLNNAKLTHIQGSWILYEGSFRDEKNRSAGVYSEMFNETIYGHELVAAALNNRPVKVQKQITEGYGSSKTTHTETDQVATQACAVRVDEIKDEFKQFARKKIQEDPELAQRIEKIYNDKFNALVPMQIDDEFLPERFEGANMNLNLYGHQKRGVMRGVTAPTMLAHEVGTGKSFTLITTAMEMRRLGTAKKPMIVVQNATVAQMTADAKMLYPNAKVLSLSEKDRSAEGRRAFYAKIKFNDWDIIIVPQSTFERIPDSPERELQFIQEKIDEKKHVIEIARQTGANSRELSNLERELKNLEQEYGDKYLDNSGEVVSSKKKKKDAKREAASLDKAETKAREQLDRAVDDVQYFDDLGVDALLVDEAHEYKHLGFQTSIGRGIKGIDPSYSKKCAGLYNKTRSVFEKAGWKNVVFATGTPISNTAAEIWTFMKYLMPADVMKANDIYYFDDFVHNFGNISQMLEFSTSGKFKENTRFAAYVNKPELIRIWSQVADTVLTKEVAKVQEKIPEQEGGKDQDIFLPQSPSLIRIMAAVRRELERFEKMTGKEKKENSSIPITMYGIAKRAAIDPRLVDAEAPDEPMSKTNAAVKEILKDLEATKDYKGTVAVFCDNQNRKGADGSIKFNIYDDMKAKLIKAGVPESQIAIIKSGMSIIAKQKVFDAVNSGDIRVVLGSTQTLGTGVNMQERLHLLIHMDAPDRPMDYTQRNGRIKRQGNLHKQWGKTIRVLRFGVEDSLDVTAYQRLKTKSGFIDSIMDGKGALANNQVDRTVEEEEEGLFDNPVAVLSGSQYALKKNQAERELRKYQSKKAQWENDQIYVNSTLKQNKRKIKASDDTIKKEEKALAHIRSLFPDGKVKTITVEGTPVDMSKEDTYGKVSTLIKEKINDPVNAIVKRNRENAIYNDEELNYTIELDGHPVNFTVQVVRESVVDNGRMRTVIHKWTTYKSADLRIGNDTPSSKSVRDILDEILEQVVTGQDYQDRITSLQQRIDRLNEESAQLQQRVGMEFQFGKELEEAKKHVEEYTELMKKEMEEKEAKYAAQQKEAQENGGFDLRKAEDNDEDDEVRYSADEDIEPTTTDNFKAWFGDWENDPEHASKVVNEDGTPKVVYHGSNLTKNNNSTPFYVFNPNSHFGTEGQATERLSQSQSKAYMDFNLRYGMPLKMELTKVYPVFLNIRNPKRVSDVPMDEDVWDGTQREWWEKQVRKAKEQGYDGLVYLNEYEDREHPADSYIAFYPEQIKSADENVGTYDANNPDIRHRMNEEFEDGETHPITVTYGYSSYDVLRRTATYSTDLMPDEYGSEQSLLDAVRTAYPNYYVRIENGNLVFDSWKHVMDAEQVAQRTAQTKAHESYVERKTRNAVNAVKSMAQQMGLDVEVLTTTEGLTGKKARAKGWFNAKTSKITLVLPNHSNQFDLVNTLLHEGVAHFGLRKMFGQNFDTFLDNVYNNVAPEIKARIDAAMKRNGWDRHEATEEYLARLAERTDFDNAIQQGWWNKIKEFFMDMLVKAGFNTVLTDNELRYILWRSYDNLLHPDSRRNIFDTAKEVEMRRKLGVNRYVKEHNRLQKTGRSDTSWMAAEVEQESPELFSIRTKEPPKKTGKGYKVFVLKDGQLYPPMVANPNGEGTPVGVWLDADAAPVAGQSKTGRPQVKAGGKGTQGGSGQLAYRPGWHLGTIPYALQFNRKDASGEKTLFPNNFVWAEVEYADDVDYQEEARQEGVNANGNYQHSLAGLKHVPTDGSYKYRTNPDPRTDEWIITGAMRVNKILSREEVDELVRKAGREPQPMQEGDVLTKEAIDELNAEIKAMKEADEMGLLYRDDYDGFFVDDIAQHAYERAVASDSIKWQEAWQDSMAGLKAIQDAIAKETGNVATGAEDAYHFENRMHGRAKNMAERYDWQYYRPMLKAFNDFCKAKGLTHEQGLDYLIAKSGLERNMYYAFRDAMKEKLTETIKKEREKLEKDYAKHRIEELEYKRLKAELAEQERTGVDDAIQQLHETLAWQRAKEDYENGDITFDELLRRRESLIRGVVGSLYDRHVKDYSGLTETFAKEWYDDAQAIRKDAQQAIDPTEKRMLWSAYNKAMDEAYKVAYQVAVDDVFGAEDGAVKLQTELWEKINAATKETLKHSYESGLMERKTYQKVGSMFDYYLPLRGWDEDKASDVYTYMGKENVFSPAVKKTWGRTSKSENPLAYIGNIAVSTILSGHRNLMKQHFLNYVMNNPTSLVNISESWYENIGNEGESPVWVLRTADTAGKSADEIVDIVNDFNEEMRLKQNEGKAMPVTGRLRLDVHATSGQKAEHVVEVQRAGHTYQLYINGDPKAAQALNGSAARAVSRISDTWLGRRITSINRSMAEFFTSKNPAFIISNLSRDLNMAGASVAVNEGAEYNARFIANAAKVLSPRVATGDVSKKGLLGLVGRGRGVTGMMPKLMRKYQDGKLNTHNETERYFKEFMEEGGETGFVNMLSVDSFKEKMRKEVAQMNGSSLFGSKNVKEVSARKALRLLGETFEFYNRCAEDATRFIVYMTSRQMGKTLEESIADAKDVTLNFNRKGTGEKGNAELRDLFIFVNPAIQALANMYRMATNHPLKFGAVTTAFIVGGALMPIINNWLLNLFGDDDDKDSYWNLPPWVRKNNLVFWVPGTKNYVTIPLAQEFRVFYGIGEMASSVAMEHPVDKWGLEVFSSVADLVPINPTGNGGNLMVDFAPTMVQPLMQIGENIDFTGRPIWRENQGNKFAPMYTKAYVSTPKWMTKISEGINDLTGGNEGKKGAIEKYSPIWGDYINNPAVWNHLLQGYFGGMYNTIAKGFDVGVTAASGEMPKVYQTPIINRFLNRPVERDNAGVLGEDYYHMTEQRDALQYELKVWKKKAADSKSSGDTDAYETAQEHVDEILSSQGWKRAEVINHYEKIIKDLRAGEKAAEGEDKQNIKRSISLYKQQMMEELAAIDNGKDPMEAAIEQFRNAKTLSEKKKLKLRIERLTNGDTKKPADSKKTVEKALSYQQTESDDTRSAGSDRYLELATAENIRDDARIKTVKALARPYTQHYKELTDAGKHKEAAQYRQENLQWFTVSQSIGSHERAIANNRKLLGKGNDKAIMRIIDSHRDAMLRAIDQLD